MHKLKSKKQTIVLQFIPSSTSQQSWSNQQNLFAGLESKIFDSNLSFDQYNHEKKLQIYPVASDSEVRVQDQRGPACMRRYSVCLYNSIFILVIIIFTFEHFQLLMNLPFLII